MKKHVTFGLIFGSLIALPFAAHAIPEDAYIVANQSTGFFLNPTGQNLANDIPLYENAFVQMGFAEYSLIGRSGFDSLANQTGGDLFFTGNPLALFDYQLPDEDSRGYAHYRAAPAPDSFTAGFYRWVNAADVMVVGHILWYRIEVDNINDTTPVISALFQFTTLTDSSDPLAQTFFDELMALTDDTGYLLMQGSPSSPHVLTINDAIPNGMDIGDTIATFSGTLTAVPEPAALAALFAAAALGCSTVYRRRK